MCHLSPALFRQLANVLSGPEQLPRLRMIRCLERPSLNWTLTFTKRPFHLQKDLFIADFFKNRHGLDGSGTNLLGHTRSDVPVSERGQRRRISPPRQKDPFIG